ncbi:hypothetical protein Sa4125_11160 [Aureimonas sp. SA4125]|nr:hypothetical protein Sa4125_11160 [Aureimonas sp. SA4125]
MLVRSVMPDAISADCPRLARDNWLAASLTTLADVFTLIDAEARLSRQTYRQRDFRALPNPSVHHLFDLTRPPR